MMRCPFCDADLSAAGSFRLRGGRCPQCSSILNWGDEEAPASDVPAPAPSPPPAAVANPPALPADEDALPIKDIVRTLVQRGASDAAGSTLHLQGGTTAKRLVPEMPPVVHGSPTLAFAGLGMSEDETPGSPEVDRLWRGALTVHARPSMTLKAASAAPDPAISDLLIRPFRVGMLGELPTNETEYELKEVIGEGGVGVVYAARQASIDRTVAVKMLKDEFAHKRDHRNKFLSEAVVTGELDHPNIVPIYDVGTSEIGSLFYAMKRVRGTPWSQVIQQQSLAENLRILLSVADAIAFAHSRGVVHRDLKPENVMLGDFGEVLVMDWGIALSTSVCLKSDRISQSTSMGGTPAYMAPEMATGPLDSIGAPSDVYLLGAILYEIVTGHPPHTGKDVMTCLYAAARNEIRPTDKSGELLDIAYRAMATRQPERHASVQDFQAAVREYQSHSESIVLSTRADEELAEARRTKDYQDYSRALFAFQEAHSLWLGNDRAKAGESEARLAYAATALEKEDFDLGVSLLSERDPQQATLRKELVAAQRERTARQARIKGLRRIALGLAAAFVVMLSGGFLFIANQYRVIQQANADLVTEKEKADRLNTSLTDSNKALTDEKDRTDRLNSSLTSSNQALSVATQVAAAKTKAALQAQEDEAGASYLAQIGVAAERIANNSFLDAQRLLADYDAPRSQWSYFRHWEWGHLKRLCELSAGQQQVGPRIEVLARSGDGMLIVAGTAAGKAIVWETDWSGGRLRQVAELTHSGPILAVGMNHDGSRLALAGDADRGTITLYERQAGRKDYPPAGAKKLAGHTAGVLSLTFSPTREQLVSTSRDGTARLWDVASGKELLKLVGHSGPVWAADLSPDGNQIVTAGDDATVRIWRIGENAPRIYRGHDGPVYAVAWSPTGEWIGSAGRDRAIHVWRSDKNLGINYDAISTELERERKSSGPPAPRTSFHEPQFKLAGHSAEVHTLSFSQDGKFVLSGGNDNTVRRWDFRRDSAQPGFVTTFRGHGGWIRGCVLGPDARYAASGSLDGYVKLWDAQQYEEVRILRSHDDAVLWAAFSRDGQRIVTAGRDRQALVWSTSTAQPVLVLDEGEPAAADPDAEGLAAKLKEGHDYLVTSAAFLADGRRALTSGGDGTVRLWDLQTGGQVRRLMHTGTQGVLALSANSKWILTGSDSGSGERFHGALLWSVDNLDAPPAKLTAHSAEVSAVAFSPASELAQMCLATGDVVGNVYLWRFQPAAGTWQASERLPGHTAGYPITAIAFTPDGRRVLTASQDRTVMLHNANSGELLPLTLRHQGGLKGMALSKDGSTALTLCSPAKNTCRVSVWDLATGTSRLCDMRLPSEPLTSIGFHPDQKSAVVTSTTGNTSRFWKWDLTSADLTPLWPGDALRGTVWSATFSPDGSRLLALGGSRARLLTADRGTLEKTLSPHGQVTAANFSPSGRLVATGSLDGDVKLWFADPASPQCGRVALKIPHPHGTAERPGIINFVAFSPVESDAVSRLVTAGSDGTAQIWRIEAGAASREQTLAGHAGRVRSTVFSPDGRLVLTASDDKTARLWDPATGQPAGPNGGVLKHGEGVLFADFAPGGKLIISGCDDNNAYVWDLADGAQSIQARLLQGHTAAVTSAAISPNDRRAITGSQDGIAKLWDLATGKEILGLKRHGAELTSVHFSPDGSNLLTSSLDQTAILWPAVSIGPSIRLSSSQLQISRTPGVHAIDPQAQLIDPDAAGLAGGTLRVWLKDSAQAGRARLTLANAGGFSSLASPVAAAGSGESLEMKLLPGADPQSVQRLLRSIALEIRGPLDSPVTVDFQLVDGSGRESSVAEAEVQSEAAPAARQSLASTVSE